MPVPFRKTEKALSNGPCICMGHFCIWGTDPLSRLRRQLVPLFVAWRERVGSRTNPLSLAALDSSPEGGALGKEDKSRPHSSTARRSQLISTKLYASAKASPFRERWHGGAVTERVGFRKNPLSRLRRQLVPLFVAWRRHLPPAGGSLSTQVEALAKRVSLVLTSQRLEETNL